MSAQLDWELGLPKTYKAFTNIPNFYTSNTSYYKIGQCLSSVLQLLTINSYTQSTRFL